MSDETPIEGNWMQVYRLRKGLSLAAVAEYAGVTPAYLALVETNRATPSVRVTYWVADILGREDVRQALWPFVGKVPKNKPPFPGASIPQEPLFDL